jgi:hypothetical protein
MTASPHIQMHGANLQEKMKVITRVIKSQQSGGNVEGTSGGETCPRVDTHGPYTTCGCKESQLETWLVTESSEKPCYCE